MLAIVCPGQGSQRPGMLAAWLEAPGARDLAAALSQAAGLDLIDLGCNADAATIRDTANAQPLIVAASLLSAHALGLLSPGDQVIVAGHSVGEFAAVALAGFVSVPDAVRLVAVRGAAMAAAAAGGEGSMSAVVGGDLGEVLSRIAQLGLTPANYNGTGQVVAAGSRAALDQLAAAPPARARVIALDVAGAFHSPFMAPATVALQDEATAVTWNEATSMWLSDADGALVTHGAQASKRLVAQVTAPVRWDLVTQSFSQRGVTGILELAPSGVLTGLVRRALPGVERLAVTSPDDLKDVSAFVAAHIAKEAPRP